MDEYHINGLTIKKICCNWQKNGNKKFTESLHPGIENVLGTPHPCLRRLGAQIAKDDWEELSTDCGYLLYGRTYVAGDGIRLYQT